MIPFWRMARRRKKPYVGPLSGRNAATIGSSSMSTSRGQRADRAAHGIPEHSVRAGRITIKGLMLLAIHIAAGGLAIVLGAIALSVKKGGTIHRRVGLLFVCAMVVMGTSAPILGFRKSPTDGNVFAGFMVAYFVVTALMTVRAVSPWTRRINVAMLPIPLGLAILDIL